MKKIFISAICLSTVLIFSNCGNTTKKQDQHEHHDHEGHDHHDHDGHEHHDHDGHDHHSEADSQYNKTEKASNDLSQKAPVAQIPAFKFYKVKSGISFTNADLVKNKKSIFILFDPGCGHCRSEATALSKNYAKIKDVNIYFVSMNDPALMATFLETFGKELAGKANVEVLYDKDQEFIQKFHIPKQFPANYVYDTTGKLQSYWDGEKDINFIIKEYTK